MKSILVILSLAMSDKPVTIEMYRDGFRTAVDSVNVIIKIDDTYHINRNGKYHGGYKLDAITIYRSIDN